MKDGVLIIGATAASFEVTENGIYTCIVTLNGCSSGASNSMIVICVGLENLSSAQLEIFPVPNKGFLPLLAHGQQLLYLPSGYITASEP